MTSATGKRVSGGDLRTMSVSGHCERKTRRRGLGKTRRRGDAETRRAVRSGGCQPTVPPSALSPRLRVSASPRLPFTCAFTLIELILVMALLAIVLAVSAPALSTFFQGRTLDSEVRRFLSLTRYGQSRAVSEG